MIHLHWQFIKRLCASAVLLLVVAGMAGLGIVPQAQAQTLAQSKVASTGSGQVVVIPLKGTVDPVMHTFMKRAFQEAEALQAEAVVIEMDTPGGRLDSASKIGQLIADSPLRTIVFVHGKAASAGSYIALNADEIAMASGSAIGSAAIVNGNHELVEDPKLIAMWISLMQGAAEKNGRDGLIAKAMVDVKSKIDLPSISKTKQPGEVLSMNTKEALKSGYAEYEASSVENVLQQAQIKDTQLMPINMQVSEQLAIYLTNPIIATILLFIGIAGVAIELIVPGFGVPGILGIVGFALYFFGAYVAGLAGMETIVLFIIGLVLLALELFVPSFGILGILGGASLITGVVRAAYDTSNALLSLGIAFVAAVAVVIVTARIFKHKGIWNKFILKDKLTAEAGYVSHLNEETLLHQIGIALTSLRPAGTAMFGERKVDVVTDGTFIDKDKSVEVIQVEGVRVVVREAVNHHEEK
ncbi:NfeD family protein [Paenibacillus sp. UMB4589-SE434]|uniref:NfeD family protein n=1 Tax=Paenibacillus sp. UMB4589-SE434 TaxID=3046314 RepID=UPI00254E4A7E|nr:NfeD family protein [Paenibacillus sp. UMB4589-SE434]MDK8180993.1 NfeD family protein [Paenibacillus sp. UMB4589-SE434]